MYCKKHVRVKPASHSSGCRLVCPVQRKRTIAGETSIFCYANYTEVLSLPIEKRFAFWLFFYNDLLQNTRMCEACQSIERPPFGMPCAAKTRKFERNVIFFICKLHGCVVPAKQNRVSVLTVFLRVFIVKNTYVCSLPANSASEFWYTIYNGNAFFRTKRLFFVMQIARKCCAWHAKLI